MARRRFQPKISRARFVVSPFTSEQMVEIGQVAVDSILHRLERGQNVSDQPATPLKERYQKYKARRSPPAIRNWRLTGRTLRALRVLRANENRAVIGFRDPEAGRRAAINNRRERQFGLSPANWRDVIERVKQVRFVRAERQAA
jgi:hypothetical protein